MSAPLDGPGRFLMLNSDRRALLPLLGLYYLLAFAVLAIWSDQGRYHVTGDEPHYLTIARSLGDHQLAEISRAYEEELATRSVYPPGLAPVGADVDPLVVHGVPGPNGLYSVHNIGLPLLLALPMKWGGVMGAKVALVLLSGGLVVLAWQMASLFISSRAGRVGAVAGLSLALPWLPASNQVYPDVVAGMLATLGIYWLLSIRRVRPHGIELALALAVAFLPWLQIKLFAPSLILIASIAIAQLHLRRLASVAIILASAVGVWASLAVYNQYAFGKPTGPYTEGALEISEMAMLVLAGLHLDQVQGFLLQNPLLLIGLFGVGLLWYRNKIFTLIWVLVFSSLIVPNGLHPAWYGGFSFVGRFAWSAAMVFWLPALLAFALLYERRRKLFWLLIGSGLLLQAVFFVRYLFGSAELYNSLRPRWVESYAIFYAPLDQWFPVLFDVSWGYRYAPNWAWLAAAVGMVLLGWLWAGRQIARRGLARGIGALALIIVVGRLLAEPPQVPLVYEPAVLPSQTGTTEAGVRYGRPGVDQPGYLMYGPYTTVKAGQYRFTLRYRSQAPADEQIASWDVFSVKKGVFTGGAISGTEGEWQLLQAPFESDETVSSVELRVLWQGGAEIEIESLTLTKDRASGG